jgi:hypothetical protein
MSSESGPQHALEFGGSHVGRDFDGTINFRLHGDVPVITVSYTFGATTARQFRYLMGATLSPQEYHFHQRYQYLVVDLRAVTGWIDDTPEFVAETRETMRRLGGELYLVAYDAPALLGSFPTFETVDEALAAVNADREQKRAARRR